MIKLVRTSLGITSALLKDKEFLKHLYLYCTEQIDETYYSEEDVVNIENVFERRCSPSSSVWLKYAMYYVDEEPLASDAEDDSSMAAQGHSKDDDQDNADITAWMDAFEADEDTACLASF